MRDDEKVHVANKMWGRSLRMLCFIACMAMAGSLWLGCSEKTGEEAIKRQSVTGVTVSTITLSRADEMYEASGTVRSDRTTVLASRVMGTVTSLNVKEGDTVKAGQLLLTLDDTDARQRARAATMAAQAARQKKTLAEVTWKRYQGLFDRQAISRQEMDQVQASKDMAEAEYERAMAMAEEAGTYLAFTRIVASSPGVVTAKHTDVGSMASPGMPLLTIEGIGDAYVEMHADEGFAGRITSRMGVEVIIDAMKKTLKGTIREVLPDIDPGTRTFTVKIDLPDKNLRTGLFARVLIPVGARELMVVPRSAIVRKGQLAGVYVVADNRVITYRLIKEGPATGSGIEVLSGLKHGERIITEGSGKAVDGGIVTGGVR